MGHSVFGTKYRLNFLMRLQLLRLLQSFAHAIYLVICYRLQIVYCRFGTDLSVRVPVYTFACTYFYSLIVGLCSMSKCCVNFNMKKRFIRWSAGIKLRLFRTFCRRCVFITLQCKKPYKTRTLQKLATGYIKHKTRSSAIAERPRCSLFKLW